ncbi:hypothetical protein E2C01_006921 [Portunus trituberculatus]|uniref:Uncharacterized protein n=1 Tax=Portunus trituberculatus TaxID=210409 RepID=A0A5B7CZF7_PORTR|nr:hypothetical protein [Portunus trituberculatus]
MPGALGGLACHTATLTTTLRRRVGLMVMSRLGGTCASPSSQGREFCHMRPRHAEMKISHKKILGDPTCANCMW